MARQHEHNLEFVRRPASEDRAAPEKATAKESKEVPARSTAGGGHRRRGRSARVEEPEAPASKPAAEAVPAPLPPVVVNAEVEAPQGRMRGRIFWRFNSDSRRLEGHGNGEPPVAKAGARSGRQTAGRLARRARGWWRRRTSSQAGQSDTAAKQEAAQVSEPVKAAQE